MKILIASDLHYPTINGVATFSRNLARGLASRGHEVLVIAPSQNGKKSKEVDGNHVIVRTASVPFPFYQNFRISLTPAKEVKQIIDEFDPDVIHIQMLMWIGQAAMKYANKIGIPIVTTNHAMPENLMDNLKLLAPVSRPINYVLKAYGARFHSQADFITMPTKTAISMFNVKKVSTPMTAISNGIDLSRFTPGKADEKIYKKFNIPKNKKIVGFVGRLDAEKHLPILIKAFARVQNALPNSHLLIVGDGTELDDLIKLAHKLKLDKAVTFSGRVTDDDLIELHRVSSVFCMPSPAELQSIATLEAMASGKPVVAVDAGALKELCKDQVNGYLCEQDDYVMIADSLIEILSNDKLSKDMAKQSLAIARSHDLTGTLEQFEKIYNDLIKS